MQQGETIYLKASDGSRVVAALQFGAQENGVAFGRYPDGATTFRRLSQPTQGTANAKPLLTTVVINEVHYHPVTENDGEEFVELYNRGTNAVNLEGWRLAGGISYTFPAGPAWRRGLRGGGGGKTNLLAVQPPESRSSSAVSAASLAMAATRCGSPCRMMWFPPMPRASSKRTSFTSPWMKSPTARGPLGKLVGWRRQQSRTHGRAWLRRLCAELGRQR